MRASGGGDRLTSGHARHAPILPSARRFGNRRPRSTTKFGDFRSLVPGHGVCPYSQSFPQQEDPMLLVVAVVFGVLAFGFVKVRRRRKTAGAPIA